MRLSLILAILSILPSALVADSIHSEAGTSAASFLRIGVGARVVALGEAFCAVADDVNSLYWNPAGLGMIRFPEISLSYEKWLLDTRNNNVTIARPAGSSGVFGGGLSFQWLGDFDEYDEHDFKVGDFNAYNSVLYLAYGRKLAGAVSFGLCWKGIYQKIEEETSSAYAFDLGLLSGYGRFKVGFSIQNMGPSTKFIWERDELPLNVRFGVSYRFLREVFLVAWDVSKARDSFVNLHFGTEIKFVKQLAFRGGIVRVEESDKTDYRAGIGIDLSKLRLDYAFYPRRVLDNGHQVSLIMLF